MKRDTTGKFVPNWETETKQQVCITLTATAWRFLEEEAHRRGMSRSEVVENFARGLNDENNLRERESRYRRLFEHNPQPMWVFDAETLIFLDVNEAAIQHYGYSRDEFLSISVCDIRPSEEIPALLNKLDKLSTTPLALDYSGVWRHRKKDGSLIDVEITAHEETYLGRRAWLVLIKDITDQKRTEMALRESEARFRLMAETIQDVFWMSDFGVPQILYVSPAYEQIWGRSRTEIYQDYSRWVETLHPDDRERVLAIATTSLHKDEIESEYRIVRPDGSIRWIRDRGFPVRNEAGEIEKIVGIAQDITDRQLAVEALKQSEAKFRRLVEVSTFGVAMGDFDGNVLYANDALLNMIGYSRDELEAGHIQWMNLTPPEQLYLDLQAVEELRQRGVAQAFEKEYIHKDGHRVPIMIGAALLNEPYTEQEQIICFYLDLTELKRTEAALREQQILLSTILKQAADAIIVCNAEGRITFVNSTARRLAQQDPEESLPDWNLLNWGMAYDTQGQPIPPEDYAIAKALRGEASSAFESRMVRSDGSYYDILISAAPLQNSKRQIIGAIATFVDISDRKRDEEALRRSEERFRISQELSLDAFTILDSMRDKTGAIVDFIWAYVNPKAAEILRHPVEDLIGQRLLTVSPNNELNRELFQRYRQVVETGEPHDIELPYNLDGATGWFRNMAVKLGDGVAISFNDITQRKNEEAEREQLLKREQAARAEAERANRIKDEFLAVLSHELRSPLNPILGWSSLLQSQQLDASSTKRALATIERNAKLQTQLIDDLLDVSRILRGKMALNIHPVNLTTVVESALETVQLAAEAKHIHIETHLALGEHSVSGDSTRLQQIVWNLLSNAVKFTPHNGQVCVYLCQVDQDAQIQIKDTGKGINPEFLPYVFDYFRQEDSKTTRKFGGLGLGLAIVRYLTELHGGTVQAESPGDGQGATFTVRLPLLRGPARSRSAGAITAPNTDLSQLQVLVVDDDTDMRELVYVILSQQGAQVVMAASAIEGLVQFDSQPPDILISDIGMPEMDGYSLIQQIRKRSPERGGGVPAIALTAYAGEYDEQQARQAGFQQHLAKPVEPEALIKAIASLLEQK
ncbi:MULTISPECIES: PAS domain S-box protein [unclassified Leptolyngbya]|uniref:PAS domain S-box protein n=1 Tax=unclassified Leptolyngbya TaxID=2650499 RepID=UPI0016840418|nr:MULTISPECIES: PAS domain S-box protein [unclassified Leptolyngbya]MBD1909838.1 PAS domain S-box protein [Leptolyngbya sp. FACHB-8]MBD2158989.1 PAS domain S-box protein [Leptolyngbya sp. FACHB-16]